MGSSSERGVGRGFWPLRFKLTADEESGRCYHPFASYQKLVVLTLLHKNFAESLSDYGIPMSIDVRE